MWYSVACLGGLGGLGGHGGLGGLGGSKATVVSVASVVSVERVPALAERARLALEKAGVSGVTVVVGDGSLGWKPGAPYDVILVAAAGPKIPEIARGLHL